MYLVQVGQICWNSRWNPLAVRMDLSGAVTGTPSPRQIRAASRGMPQAVELFSFTNCGTQLDPRYRSAMRKLTSGACNLYTCTQYTLSIIHACIRAWRTKRACTVLRAREDASTARSYLHPPSRICDTQRRDIQTRVED